MDGGDGDGARLAEASAAEWPLRATSVAAPDWSAPHYSHVKHVARCVETAGCVAYTSETAHVEVVDGRCSALCHVQWEAIAHGSVAVQILELAHASRVLQHSCERWARVAVLAQKPLPQNLDAQLVDVPVRDVPEHRQHRRAASSQVSQHSATRAEDTLSLESPAAAAKQQGGAATGLQTEHLVAMQVRLARAVATINIQIGGQ